MKRKICLFAFLIGLTAFSAFAGGVAVGNGKRLYRSPFGFTVQFENGLALSVDSENAFRISNAPLVNAGESISEVSFTVSRGEVTSLEGVERTAAKEHPKLRFTSARQRGAEGFASEERLTDALIAHYYFLTSNGDFVRISLKAYALANGINFVAPIVGTLTYDVTPPIFLEMTQDQKGVWLAGTERTFRFKITDDNAGVSLYSIFAYFAKIENGQIIRNRSFYSIGPLKPEGNDWYSLSVTANRFLPGGEYVMELRVDDLASNGANLNFVSLHEPYQGNAAPLLPFLITVKNPGATDITLPRLRGFRAITTPWKAGSTNKIYFSAGDPESGIDVSKLESIGLVSDFKIGDYPFYSNISRNPKDEGNGWYSLELSLDPYVPSGRYHVSGVRLTNGANNSAYFTDGEGDFYASESGQSDVPLLHLNVENDAVPDVTAPLLIALRLDTTNWLTGGTYRLHFRATDRESGMYVSPPNSHPSLQGYFKPVDGSSDTIYVDQPVDSEGDDWYGVNINVSSFIRGREFYLSHFSVTDRAGNSATYSCEKDSGESSCTNSSGPSLPRLKVNVSR